MMKLNENIKKYRLRKSMTQEMLASAVGVSAQAVSKWECGESIPDGALLVPIADILGVSLDTLFGSEKVYEEDVYRKIIHIVDEASQTSAENQINKIREICWQTQKGLVRQYQRRYDNAEEFEYKEDEITTKTNLSRIENDHGFTLISNEHSHPFYSVFSNPEPDTIKYDENHRGFFEALGNEQVFYAVLNLYKIPNGISIEKNMLAEKMLISGTDEGNIDFVINQLVKLRLCTCRKINLNGTDRDVYKLHQKSSIMAILMILTDYYNSGVFDYLIPDRHEPYLK